ncbi:muconolactone Delta-isomerase family protein [Chloroflexi bacterium TSY]|nr:muconolactone Delta-isomerase family protein [Chloroflexi bacterium TSY]
MRFLIKSTFKAPPTDEVLALIPVEQAKVKELAEQGLFEALYVADDRSAAWGVWNCDSQDALEELHETLPLHNYLNIDITLLSDDF